MRRSDQVRLFQTLPHACGYYADRTAQNQLIDPASPNHDKLYCPAKERRIRIAGGHQ
jgi:arginine-tRNA-protein transferase